MDSSLLFFTYKLISVFVFVFYMKKNRALSGRSKPGRRRRLITLIFAGYFHRMTDGFTARQ
jgi:hypothetical protein